MQWDVCNALWRRPGGKILTPEKFYTYELRVVEARVKFLKENPKAKFFPVYLYSMEPIK